MSDFDDRLEQMQADGRISTHDADEVRNFASFLEAIPARGDQPWTREQRRQFGDAYREHYPEDFERAVAERAAEGGKS